MVALEHLPLKSASHKTSPANTADKEIPQPTQFLYATDGLQIGGGVCDRKHIDLRK